MSGFALLLLCGAMLLLGGAGEQYPLAAAAAQSLAVVILIATLLMARTMSLLAPFPRIGFVVVTAVAALLCVQLVPMPPALWHATSGRQLAASVQQAAGIVPGWHSLSLDPVQSAVAAMELLPGLALLVVGCTAGRRLLHGLVATVLAVAMFSALLAGLQRFSRQDWLFPFGFDAPAAAGIFINHNHQATLLLVAIPLAAYWISAVSIPHDAGSGARRPIAWSLVAILAVGTIATTSRAGFLLLVVAVLTAWLILRESRASLRSAAATLLPIGVVIAIMSQLATVQLVLDRFSQEKEARPGFWSATLEVSQAYWPLGSGIGTFTRIYPTIERRQDLSNAYVNNAHNDYVEQWLEGGLVSAAVLLILLVAIGYGAYRQFATGDQRDIRRALAGCGALLIVMLHSLFDYPLRMLTLMGCAGLLLAMVIRTPDASQRAAMQGDSADAERHKRHWPARAAMSCAAAALLVPIWAAALAQRALDEKHAETALAYVAFHPEALVLAGYASLKQGHPDIAEARAMRALAVSPFTAEAAELLIDSFERQGKTEDAQRVLVAAARLGWREAHIQYRLLYAASEGQDYARAVLHADALLRTGGYANIVLPYVRQLESEPDGIQALISVLAESPRWRGGFLGDLRDLDLADARRHLALLEGLRRAGAPPTEGEITAFVSYLLASHEYAFALRVADRLEDWRPGPDLLDPRTVGALDHPGAARDPFGWRIGDALSVRAVVDGAGDITIDSDHAVMGMALTRLIIVPPGPFVLKGWLSENRPGSLQWFDWTLTCSQSRALLLPASRRGERADAVTTFELRFEIPAEGCSAQTLALNLDNATAGGVSITLHDLRGVSPR